MLYELDDERTALLADPQTTMGRYVNALPTLRGIGPIGTWTLTTEIFGWRQIKNGRQLGALVGLVPAPYQSGESAHDQGITRAGNKHVRRLMVQLAWCWVRYQPDSALTRWYAGKFGHVVGVDRGGHREALVQHGADAVVGSGVLGLSRWRANYSLPSGTMWSTGKSPKERS